MSYLPRPDDLVSVPELARALKILTSRLRKGIEIGEIPGPTHRHGARLYYGVEDIEAVRPLVKTLDLAKKTYRGRRIIPVGYYGAANIANLAGVHPITVKYHTNVGRIKRPTHKLPHIPFLLYNEEEKDAIIELLKNRDGFKTVGIRGPREI